MKKGRVFSINISKIKGVSKIPVDKALLIKGFGVEQDAHAGSELRQVSLLAIESISKQNEKISKNIGNFHQSPSLNPGAFAENITTEGISLLDLKVGAKLKVGEKVLIEISKIGKECHKYCAIYYKTGDCIMPKEGIFARVLEGGEIYVGDSIVEA